ncbi:MAG: hypothetical protein ACSLFI_07835 [Solirubrobacterales bacterium]
MSAAPFYFGMLQLALVVLALGFTAYRVRARILPGFEGATARLSEAVIGFTLLVLLTEVLGLFSLFHNWTLVPVSLILALIAWLRVYPAGTNPGLRPPAPSISTAASVLALVIAGIVVAQWAAFASYSLDHGISNFDSVWYHLPFSADMFQTGSVLKFHQTETVFLNWFYPQNSEIAHAAGMALTGRDFVSVFINMGWLGMALLAGWCVGRPYGRPHLTMIAAAVLLATHTLVAREPGTGKNDIVAIALTISVVAILINRGAAPRDGRGRISPDWAMAIAGLAAGLAAGTKVTALAPVAMITFAVLYATIAGKRLRAAGVWFGAALVGGGFWYLRSLLASGNPLPQIEAIGPINLPGPDRLQVGRPDFNVLHYVTDLDIWRDYFLPGLERGFGELWPLLIAVAIIGLFSLIWKGPGRLTQGHAIAALLAIAAYVVTPLGAAGPEGEPTAFAINLRFLIPALAMAIVLVPLLPWFDRKWPRYALTGVLLILFLASSRSDAIYEIEGRAFGVAFALVVVGLIGGAWLFRARLSGILGSRSPIAVASFLAAVLALLVAFPLADHYSDSRYQDFEPESGLAEPYRWANDLEDSHIGLAGSTAGFKQYGFFGEDLSNEVTYIGHEVAAGGFEAIPRCIEFREAVNSADVDYLITSSFLNFNDYEKPIRSPERAWVEGDPALSRVGAPGPVQVWQVNGQLDPAGCEGIGPADEYIPGLESETVQ